MKLLKNALVASSFLLGTSVLAQQGEWAPAGGPPPESANAVPLSQAESRRGPTWQPGNAEAKEFARVTGKSIGEATSEMRRMAALNRFVERLQQRRPELFSFVAMRDGKLVIGLTDPSANLSDLLPRGLLDPEFVEAALSARETDAILQRTTADLRAAGFEDVSVGITQETGRMTVLAGEHVEAVRAALESGSIAVDLPYDVESGGIEVSATLVGSASWNVDPSRCSTLCGGTTGFSVMSTGSSQTRYVTTAGHVDNGRARYNQYADSSYSSGGYVSLGSVIDLLPNGLDVQLASPTDAASNPPGPYIWDGYEYVSITGAIYPIGGIIMCKFGRYTGPGCGTTEDPVRTWRNNNYPTVNVYMIKKPSNITTSKWNLEGDSGGPVYRGTYAAGWIHGRHKDTGDLFYTSSKSFRQSAVPYDFIVVP